MYPVLATVDLNSKMYNSVSDTVKQNLYFQISSIISYTGNGLNFYRSITLFLYFYFLLVIIPLKKIYEYVKKLYIKPE